MNSYGDLVALNITNAVLGLAVAAILVTILAVVARELWSRRGRRSRSARNPVFEVIRGRAAGSQLSATDSVASDLVVKG